MFLILKIFLVFCYSAATIAQDSQKTELVFCINNFAENKKCEKMSTLVKDVNLRCDYHPSCIQLVDYGQADFSVIRAEQHFQVTSMTRGVLFEAYDDDNIIVAVINENQKDKIAELPLFYNLSDFREAKSALYLNQYQRFISAPGCELIKKPEKGGINITRYRDIEDKTNKLLVCVENDRIIFKSLDNYKRCHIESFIPNAVVMRLDSPKRGAVMKMFTELSTNHYDDFKLFGLFENQYSNVLFTDEATKFVTLHPIVNDLKLVARDILMRNSLACVMSRLNGLISLIL